VTLLIPNGAWRPDTVITDSNGNEYFVVLDVENKMRSYEAIFGDLEGNRLICVKRHLKKAFWKDGFYFCTYRPNYKGQRALRERDRDNKRVYPHSYVRLDPLKGRFYYAFFDDQQDLGRTRLYAENQWLGMMMVCCTPLMRWGRFTGRFKKKDNSTQIFVDQWRNSVRVLPGQDVLASLCLAYIFDKCQSQPMVAVMGRESDDEYESDDGSVDIDAEYDHEEDNNYYQDHPERLSSPKEGAISFENMPDSSQREFDDYLAEDEGEFYGNQTPKAGMVPHDPYTDGKPLGYTDKYNTQEPYNNGQPFEDVNYNADGEQEMAPYSNSTVPDYYQENPTGVSAGYSDSQQQPRHPPELL
jgi:hypothetical protein